MKLDDFFYKIISFFKGKKYNKKDYLIKNTDIPFFDIPYAAFLVIKKYGWVVFFYKAINYIRIFPEKTKNQCREAALSLKNEGLKVMLIRSKNFVLYGKGFLDKNLDNYTNRVTYDKWIQKNENWNIFEIKKEIDRLSYKPKISVITPVYNVDSRWLDKCIESVKNQFYENWELCLYDDASIKKETVECLKKWENTDLRIKIFYGEKNQHISGASNEALKMATGEFIALLDDDDELAPQALFEVVELLNKHPEADFIYSDEDKIEMDGTRNEPFFKPDWSLDFFLSMMYTCHLGVYRKKIIDQIGGFRKGYEGSQDYDLVLRFIDKINSKNIFHISKVLYHWRKILGSTSRQIGDKEYVSNNSKEALRDYLKRNNIIGSVEDGLSFGRFRVRRHIRNNPKVSIIIPFRDQSNFLKKCLTSILDKTDYDNYEILLVDNQSLEKETLEYLNSLKDNQKIKIIKYNAPFNFSAINNYAAKNADGEYILFLNNDTKIINTEWLSSMVEHIQRDEVGAVGAKLIYPNNTIQHAGVVLGIGIASHAFKHFPKEKEGLFSQLNVIKNYSAVTAACMIVKKKLFFDLEGFNEKDLSIAYNDVDLCLNIRERGLLIVYTPYARLYHFESLTRGNDEELKYSNPKKYTRVLVEREYMTRKWKKYIDNDPHYNPNLTRKSEDFRLRCD